MKYQLLLVLLFVISSASLAQSPQISPLPGSITWCPGEEFTYQVITPGAQQTSCKYNWTVTNGTIVSEINEQTVRVKWNDTPGTGKLKVTLTNCSEASNTSDERNYAIRSLKDKTPQNLDFDQLPPYCSVAGVNLSVDVMFLENTGGATGIPQQRADGYEWTLPTGWKHNGVGGTVRTSEEYISIQPDNGCATGSISVKAYMNCGSGRKCSSSTSISLNRTGFSTPLGVPAGYSGPKCGNVAPVVFTAANLPCAQTYRWTATGTSWKDGTGAAGPWTTASNTITLYPEGNSSDGGVISVDINIGCATLVPNLPGKLHRC